MSAESESLLLHDVVPRLRSAIRIAVAHVGSEDDAELLPAVGGTPAAAPETGALPIFKPPPGSLRSIVAGSWGRALLRRRPTFFCAMEKQSRPRGTAALPRLDHLPVWLPSPLRGCLPKRALLRQQDVPGAGLGRKLDHARRGLADLERRALAAGEHFHGLRRADATGIAE